MHVLDIAGRRTADHLCEIRTAVGGCDFGLCLIERVCDEVRVEETDVRSLLIIRMHTSKEGTVPVPRRPDEPSLRSA